MQRDPHAPKPSEWWKLKDPTSILSFIPNLNNLNEIKKERIIKKICIILLRVPSPLLAWTLKLIWSQNILVPLCSLRRVSLLSQVCNKFPLSTWIVSINLVMLFCKLSHVGMWFFLANLIKLNLSGSLIQRVKLQRCDSSCFEFLSKICSCPMEYRFLYCFIRCSYVLCWEYMKL